MPQVEGNTSANYSDTRIRECQDTLDILRKYHKEDVHPPPNHVHGILDPVNLSTDQTYRQVMASWQALLKSELTKVGPRLGQLIIRNKPPVNTPHYIASTSRGVVPHVSHDILAQNTSIRMLYIGLEDFVEKSRNNAPIYKTPITQDDESRLAKYISLPQKCISIFGPRRVDRIECPAQNNNSAISISTSVGFSRLEAEDYFNAAATLRPDAVLSLADLVDAKKISIKRLEKSADRTHAWLRDHISAREKDHSATPKAPLFASIPPLEIEQQQFYLGDLKDEYRLDLAGLCLHSPSTSPVLPEALQSLPKMLLTAPSSPQAILHAISLGIDLLTLPLPTMASEAGAALTFAFPGQSASTSSVPQPLGINLWTPEYSTKVVPLSDSCTCYACTRHHAAYINHLLNAKEMLAWTLLQIHNHHVLDQFFNNIRKSIEAGTFEHDHKVFRQSYEDTLPETTGAGPRIRGYQMRSQGNEGGVKRNAKAYGRFDSVTSVVMSSGDNEGDPIDVEDDSSCKIAEATEEGIMSASIEDEGEKSGLAEEV